MLSIEDRRIVRVTDNDLLAAMQILACIARPDNQRKREAGGKLLQAWFWARKRHRGEPVPELEFLHAKSLQRNRIESALEAFLKDLWQAWEAGVWLHGIIFGSAPREHPWFASFSGISQRSLAAQHWNKKNANRLALDNDWTRSSLDDAGNIRAKIWRKRRPIVHMALAAANEIVAAAQKRERPSEKLKQLEAAWLAITPDCQRAIEGGESDAPAIAEWNRLSKSISEERRSSRRSIELEAIVFDPVWVAPALEQAEAWAATIESRNLVSGAPLWRFVR